MEQLSFPGLEPRAIPGETPAPPIEEGTQGAAPPADERQLGLFADRVAIEREIDHALHVGDFEEALRLREIHRETYGAAPATAGLGFLDILGANPWGRPPAEALSAWEAADEDLRDRPVLRRRVRDGFFRRLLAVNEMAELAKHPSCVGALLSFLTSEARAAGSDRSTEARRLVRDLLLSDRPIAAVGIERDAPLADLLAEDMTPRWLACLGAVRRLWPVPAATALDLPAFEGGLASEEAALRFWQCLRVAETPGRPEALLLEARRRMKRLQPDLHALYMRRTRPATEG